MIKVTIYNEFRHEQLEEAVRNVYPTGIHGCIADFLGKNEDFTVRTATLDTIRDDLSDSVLEDTDVLIWWGHIAHGEVPDDIVEKVKDRVLRGMGFIGLHSAHHAKPFKALMGTTCHLRWRDGDFERLWTINPTHPIAAGLPACFELEQEEMYGEQFDIPTPDDIVFLGWFRGGEVMRSGCTFHRGAGKIFYFQPGHEYYPVFYNENIRKVITNAVRWAAPTVWRQSMDCYHSDETTEERYAKGIKEIY